MKIPLKDVNNYGDTVEPIRLLQTLSKRVLEEDPARPGFSAAGVEELRTLAAVLSTSMLIEASYVARDNRHAQVEDDDVVGADVRIAEALGLEPYDGQRFATAPAPVSGEDAFAGMAVIIEQKIESLTTFNTDCVVQ